VAANEAKIVITADDKASGALDGISKKAKSMRKAFLAVSGAVTGVGIVSIKFASDLDEAINKATVTFGNASGVVKEFGEASAASFGISERAANEYAGTLGTILNASGVAQSASADMSVELVKLAADMASFNNIPIDVALEKLRSGLVGEVEPLRTVGVLLNSAAVQTQAYNMGIAAQGAQLTEAQKVQARYALILQQTTAQQGDFTRTSDSLANSTRIMKAQLEDAAAELGQQLLPAAQKVVEIANNLIGRFSELSSGTKTAILVLGGVAGAVATLGLVVPPLITGITALRTAMLLLATTNPLLLAFTAITTAIVVVIANWHHFEGVIIKGINYLIKAAEMYANTWVFVINKIIDGINTLGSVFGVNIGNISDVELPRLQQSMKDTSEVSGEMADDMQQSMKDTSDASGEMADHITEDNDRIVKSTRTAADAIVNAAQFRANGIITQRNLEKEAIETVAEAERQAADEVMEGHIAAAQAIVDASNERYEKIAELRAADLADDLASLKLRSDAVEALKAENLQAFRAIEATVNAAPSLIQVGGGSAEERTAAGSARRAFKDSQNDIENQLAEARARTSCNPTSSRAAGLGSSSSQKAASVLAHHQRCRVWSSIRQERYQQKKCAGRNY
jgi:hypothetical protein